MTKPNPSSPTPTSPEDLPRTVAGREYLPVDTNLRDQDFAILQLDMTLTLGENRRLQRNTEYVGFWYDGQGRRHGQDADEYERWVAKLDQDQDQDAENGPSEYDGSRHERLLSLTRRVRDLASQLSPDDQAADAMGILESIFASVPLNQRVDRSQETWYPSRDRYGVGRVVTYRGLRSVDDEQNDQFSVTRLSADRSRVGRPITYTLGPGSQRELVSRVLNDTQLRLRRASEVVRSEQLQQGRHFELTTRVWVDDTVQALEQHEGHTTDEDAWTVDELDTEDNMSCTDDTGEVGSPEGPKQTDEDIEEWRQWRENRGLE